MYKIGELKDQHTLEELKQNLVQKGITFQITQEQQGEIYVISVDNPHDVEKAQEVFNTLMGIAREFEIPPEYEKIHSIEMTVLTKNLIILCFVLYGFSFFEAGKELFSVLSLSSNPNLFLSEIKNGQIWRLFTPMFLHFSVAHILFNMMIFKDLGKIIEHSKGSKFFIYFVLSTGTLSNLCQYLITGPFFGGMSGVIYAFFGLLWMEKTLNPKSEFSLPMSDLALIIGWFFLCLFGLIGKIANTAHAVGLVTGMLTGIYLGFLNSTQKNKLKNGIMYTFLSIILLGLTLFVEYHRLKKGFYVFNFYP